MNKVGVKEETIPIKLGETEIKIVVNKTSVVSPVYLYFNMHDNENTAVEATKEIQQSVADLRAFKQKLLRW